MANDSGQKVVLITGCSSGIGLRIAVTLARDEKKRYHGKCAFFYKFFFFNRTYCWRLHDSVVRVEPCSVFTLPCRASLTPRLLYAQRSVEFQAQRSLRTRIRELVESPEEYPALLVSDARPFVEPGFRAPL